MANYVQPLDADGAVVGSIGYDATNHQFTIPQTAAGTTDPTGLYTYAPLIVQQNATQSVNGTLQNAAGANGNGTPLALLGMASVIFTVNMVGFTGTVNFEASEDGTNYDPLQMQQEGTNLIANSVTGSTTTAIHLWEGSVAGLQSARARVSGFAAGTVTVTAHAVPTSDAPRAINAVNTPGQRATYSAAMIGLTTATNAKDILTLTGSASKTLHITRLAISGTATASSVVDVLLVKRSTADTGGTTGTAPAIVPYDSNSPAATGSITVYTADPTLGTSVGNVDAQKLFVNATGTAALEVPAIFYFGNRPAQDLVLRGVAQQLCVNLNAAGPAGGVFDIVIEWEEDNS